MATSRRRSRGHHAADRFRRTSALPTRLIDASWPPRVRPIARWHVSSCHSEPGAKWMNVQRDVIGNCLACHKAGTDHFDAPPGQCATCHVPFWEMPPGVSDAQVATWKAPASHDAPDFQSSHGKLAGPVVVNGVNHVVSPACATCHAREYCISCHVNAPEVPAIQALQPDARSLAMAVPAVRAPASHSAPAFASSHGRKLSKQQLTQQCGSCHTATSCEACHLVPPQQVRVLAVAGPGRGAGRHRDPRPPRHARHRLHRWTCPARGRVAADLRRVPRSGAVPAMPPSQCRHARHVSPC